MFFTFGFLNYVQKKGLNRNSILTIYAAFYLIVCTLLIMAMHFKAPGIIAVACVYLIRIFMLKGFLNRRNIG